MNIPNHESRPFGILSNASDLSFRMGKKYYPTVEHLLLSSFLEREEDQARVLSYPSLVEAKRIFNRLDEEQFIKNVETACDRYFEKIVRKSKKIRELVRSHSSFICKDSALLRNIVGVTDGRGYNLIGQSLGRIKRILEKVPEDFLINFLPDRPVPMKNKKEYRLVKDSKPAAKKPTPTEEYDPEHPEMSFPDEYDPENPEIDDDDYPDERQDDDDDPQPNVPDAEIAFNPYAVPRPGGKPLKWFYGPDGNYIDELLYGNSDDVVMDAVPKDPFDTVLQPTLDPLALYKIFKATEYLVKLIQKGNDIISFDGKSIDAILFEGKVCPEIFGGIISPMLRREIYIQTWDRYKAGTLPYMSLVHKEVIYPGNLIGFIRKYYLKDINEAIGENIRVILFREYLRQVLVESYPEVEAPWLDMALLREWKTFTIVEYQEISNRLYHLFYEKKFVLSIQDDIRIKYHELQRKTIEQIEEAQHFLPLIHAQDAYDISDMLSERIDVRIDNRVFHDMYQWIYFNLFQIYGDISAKEAYPFIQSLRLQERLDMLIQTRRHELIKKALRVKFRTYPQIREILVYLDVTKMQIQFDDDKDLMKIWNSVASEDIDPFSRQLMTFVTSYLPSTDRHYEKSIFLYAFLLDFFRSLRIFKTIHGERLDTQTFRLFVNCLYHPLLEFPEVEDAPPTAFHSLVTSLKYVKDVRDVWRVLAPYIETFRDPDFIPSILFHQAKNDIPTEDRLSKSVDAMISIIQCLYETDNEVSNDHFYLLVQIISGKDDMPNWPDPSFDMVMDHNMNPDPPGWESLPAEIRKRLPKRKKKMKEVVVNYNFIHHLLEPYAESIRDRLQRPSVYDPMVARISFAIAFLYTHAIHTRRLRIFTK